MIFTSVKVVWGVKPNREIRGAPGGRQRLQLRQGEAAKLFIRTPGSAGHGARPRTDSEIRCFVLEDRGDHWFCNPAMEQARNVRS